MDQPAGLLSVLLDSTARVDERDDAAMDLADFDGQEVEAALAVVACDESVDELVRGSCGASLAEIWIRGGTVHAEVLRSLKGEARGEAEALLSRAGLVHHER